MTVTAAQLVYAEKLREAGDTVAEIVAKTGITRSSVYRHLPPRPPEPVTAAGPAPTDRHQDEDEPETAVETLVKAGEKSGQGRAPVRQLRVGRVAGG